MTSTPNNSNEELCERVLPLPYAEKDEVELTDDEWAVQQQVKVDRSLLKEALTQGILIPAEKMLTVEEIKKIIQDECYGGYGGELEGSEKAAQAIHQSSRQKAGV